METRSNAFGWAARDSSGLLAPFNFTIRSVGDDDVKLKILYCGICHSDLHTIKNEWGGAKYPLVPGHEIVGVVTSVGSKVKKFKIGDHAGVGCMVGSCHTCSFCNKGLENYCPGVVFTYNSITNDGVPTYGGYSDAIVVQERFVVTLPAGMDLHKAAPLLCAGVTVYSPLKGLGLDEGGKHIGVVGLGGLGHVAVKFGKAFGARVTVISSAPGKEQDAVERLGADCFLLSSDSRQMKEAMGTMDGIINTVSAGHSIMPLIGLLKTQGKMIMLGAPDQPLELHVMPLLLTGKTLTGSCIGGMRETQEVMDFAGEHGITADVEVIGIQDVNLAMERLVKGDVKYRFVIDIGNSLDPSK